jgi:excisionase family DNA binding protein
MSATDPCELDGHETLVSELRANAPLAPERLRQRVLDLAPARATHPPTKLGPRLALSPGEAADVLGVSRDYFDEHILPELRIIRRGRRILIPLAEIERWLERSAASATFVRRA